MTAGNNLQRRAHNLLSNLHAEQIRQERFERDSSLSANLINVLREDAHNENQRELYCYIAAEFLQHFKAYFPDSKQITKKRIRSFIRNLPFPNGDAFSASSEPDDTEKEDISATEVVITTVADSGLKDAVPDIDNEDLPWL